PCEHFVQPSACNQLPQITRDLRLAIVPNQLRNFSNLFWRSQHLPDTESLELLNVAVVRILKPATQKRRNAAHSTLASGGRKHSYACPCSLQQIFGESAAHNRGDLLLLSSENSIYHPLAFAPALEGMELYHKLADSFDGQVCQPPPRIAIKLVSSG